MSQTTYDIMYKQPGISSAAYLPPLNYPQTVEYGVTQDRINALQKQGITVQIIQTHTPAPTPPQQQPTVPAPPPTQQPTQGSTTPPITQQPVQMITSAPKNESVPARTIGPLGVPTALLHQLWLLRERFIRSEVHKKLHPLI